VIDIETADRAHFGTGCFDPCDKRFNAPIVGGKRAASDSVEDRSH
jgi:hypothetical protein